MKNSIAAKLNKNIGLGLLLIFLLITAPVAFGQGKEPVYEAVEYPAQPKGGYSGFQDYVSRTLTYPTFSLKNKTQGTVEVSFIIEKNGTVSSPEIVKGLDESCNIEAIRVIKNSPKWEPAKHNGIVVRQKITMPLTFTMPVPPTEPDPAAAKASNAEIPPKEDPNLKRVTPEMAAHPEIGTEDFFVYLKQNQKW
jgi:protein TonB